MWEIVCPACKKKQAPRSPNPANPKQVDLCRRCGCEIGDLFDITATAANTYNLAHQFLKSGSGDKALKQAEISWNLRRQPETAQLAFLAALFNADYDKAEQWYSLALS